MKGAPEGAASDDDGSWEKESNESRAASRSPPACRSLLLAVDATNAAEFNSTAAKKRGSREGKGSDAS